MNDIRLAHSLRIRLPTPQAPVRWVLMILGMAAYAAAAVGASLWMATPDDHISAAWPAAGIAVGWLLTGNRRERYWLIGFIASFTCLVHLLFAPEIPLWMNLGLACLEAGSPALIAWIMRTQLDRQLPTESLAAASTFLGAVVGVATTHAVLSAFAISWLTDNERVGVLWARTTSSLILGIVIAAPFAAACLAPRRGLLERGRLTEAIALVLLVSVGAAASAGLQAPIASSTLLPFIAFPAVLWGAFRFGSRLASILVAAIAIPAILIHLHGSPRSSSTSMIGLQISLLLLSVSSLLLCALLQEVRRSASRLADSNQQFARIFNLVPEGIMITRLSDGMIVDMNPGMERLSGYQLDEVRGRTTVELGCWDSAQVRLYELGALAHHDQSLTLRSVQRRKDGSQVPVEGSAKSFQMDGQTYLVSILRDVTPNLRMQEDLIRAKEAAEAGDRAKGEFLAHMSHEIRTPMNGIMGMAELLVESPLSGEDREIAATILQSSRALLTVINDILDLSRLEAGRLDVQAQPFDPRQVLSDVLALMAVSARQKHLELVSTCVEPLPRAAIGDANRLRQLLINLIGNAVKFTDTGKITVRVQVEPSGLKPTWHFRITDTGPGIPEQHVSQLFTAFYQAGDLQTRRHGGTGLGLAICKRLVTLLGGHIGVETHGSLGCTFWFTLPMAEPPAG